MKIKKKQPNLPLLEVYDSNKLDNLYLNKLEGDKKSIHRNEVTKDINSINGAKHTINLKENTFIYDIYKENKIDVVSLHSFEIARVPDNIIVSAKSSDGVIEAVEYHEDGNHILGLQFHPEVDKDNKPFLWLINNSYEKYKIIVNKNKKVPDNIDFKIVNYKSSCEKCCAEENNLEEQTLYAFLKLKDKMRKLGYTIDLESGYRYHSTQEKLYKEHADMYVAKAYHSEHELGLSLDICANINGKWHFEFDKEMDSIYKELSKIVADCGFIIRYPKDKENITGYNYEPWHLRYVGNTSFAKYIMDNNLTLEEASR